MIHVTTLISGGSNMKVHQLIAQLQRCPADMRVVVDVDDTYHDISLAVPQWIDWNNNTLAMIFLVTEDEK